MSRYVDRRHFVLFDNGTYSTLTIIVRNDNILQWCKQNEHFRRITSKYSMLHVKKK